MAQRTVALCGEKLIGIESIYTVVNGQQINIPDKLKELRKKSQNYELFCPCGCGTNLILVAGDKNLKEQHFRVKTGSENKKCSMITEGKLSIDSKIVLKCWLDDKLQANDIESRVPINMVEYVKRKAEFTFLSREKKFAIRYWRTRANIMEDRLDSINDNTTGVSVLYITDVSNGGCDGQYPEALMKLQEKQGFCLLLSIKEVEYTKASLKVVFYDKDLDGLWQENVIAEGKIKDFSIVSNNVLFEGRTLEQLLIIAKDRFVREKQIEKERREREEKLREEYALRRRQELIRQREEYVKRQKENERRKQLEQERQQEEKRRREEEFKQNIDKYLSQQETQVRDENGNRWIKCEFCGKIAKDSEFVSYGGKGRVNLGTCKVCIVHSYTVKEEIKQDNALLKKKYDPTICPDCGGKLRVRSGQYGEFYGCGNFPRCRYSRSKQ